MNNESHISPQEKYSKDLAIMRHWLLGKDYHVALSAMEFGRSFHTGLRKDGVTPEFSHQLFIAQYLKTILPGIIYKEEVLASIFLHDVCEDYDVGFDEIRHRFGPSIESPVKLLTKKYRGSSVPYETYFENMSHCPVASLCKGADRAHNIFTMSSAGWNNEKQNKYLDESDTWFLPMLKSARREFPLQVSAYENIKTMLKIQTTLIRLNLEKEYENVKTNSM